MNSYYMSTMILPISFLLFVPWVNANAIKESSGYTIKVEGSKVEIIVWNPNHLKAEIYQCDGTRVLLRENVFTKKVVQVQYQCDKGSYIDECVMLGEYRYGFLTPMNCDDSYYGDAFVESHNKSCKDQPEYEGLPPWKGKGRIIEDDCGGICGIASGGIHGATIIVLLIVLFVSTRRKSSHWHRRA